MNDLVQHHIQGHIVGQRRDNGYVAATAMCQAAGKEWSNYWQNKGTLAFADELALDLGIPRSNLKWEFRGRPANRQGTWIHPQLALNLGRWISPKFEVRITSIVMDWMAGLPRHQAFDKYLLDDPSDWQKRFQDEVWKQAYRLRGFDWPGMGKNRHQWLAGMINDVVYDRIGPPGLREELDNRNPRLPSGGRARKQHQLLVEEVGIVELAKHLHAVLALMRAADDGAWGVFYYNLNRSLPRAGGIGLPKLPKTERPAPDQLKLDL